MDTDYEKNITDVFLPNELLPDLPYINAVPLFSVARAYNITWRRYTLIARMIENCNLYYSKHALDDDLIPKYTKLDIFYNFTLYSGNDSLATSEYGIHKYNVIKGAFKIILSWHIKRSDLEQYMNLARETQTREADGLPMPTPQQKIFISNTAYAYAHAQPPDYTSPTPSPAPSEPQARGEVSLKYDKNNDVSSPPQVLPTPEALQDLAEDEYSPNQVASKIKIKVHYDWYAGLGTPEEQIEALRHNGITNDAIIAKIITKKNDRRGFGETAVAKIFFPNDVSEDGDLRKKLQRIIASADKEFEICPE